MISTLDPRFDPIPAEPKFQKERVFDTIRDDNDDDFPIDCEYHYYRHEGQSRIVFAQVTPRSTYYATEMSVCESVTELIRLYERSIVMECNVKVLEYKPEIKIC